MTSSKFLCILCLATQTLLPAPAQTQPAPTPSLQTNHYEFHKNHSPEGIGKFYLGREIAHVMGHQGADWLERPERETEEAPSLLVKSLALEPGSVVADIGAGSGYYTRRLAREVGPHGRVLAVDIQPEMLEILTNRLTRAGLTNVQPILGTITNPNLPTNALDLVLLADVYHEFSHPYEMLQAICQSLKPNGRVAFVEFRQEDPSVPIKKLHKMSETQVRKEAAQLPLQWVQTIDVLPRQHLILFRKNPPAPN